MSASSSERSPRANASQSIPTMGLLAEQLVAQWLLGQGWDIVDRRWHCRWGELDLVAHSASVPQSECPFTGIAFVEVKARSSGNWDTDGLLAITPQKQVKLWQTAQLFLAEHPTLADLPCRFDVALVRCQRSRVTASTTLPASVDMGQAVAIAGYRLTLQHYIVEAFDQS